MIPTAHQYIERLGNLSEKAQQQTNAIKLANHSLSALAMEKETLFAVYMAEVNTYLETLNLQVIFDIQQLKTPDLPHDPPPQYFLHLVLDGHIHQSVEYSNLHGAETRIAALSDFISTCKTIHTMECIKNLGKESPWVCFMAGLKQE